jgi:hypothetical protein
LGYRLEKDFSVSGISLFAFSVVNKEPRKEVLWLLGNVVLLPRLGAKDFTGRWLMLGLKTIVDD